MVSWNKVTLLFCLAVLVAWHRRRVNRAIECGAGWASRRLIVAVTVGVTVLAALMMVYLALPAQSL
jgi:hypothetical protein